MPPPPEEHPILLPAINVDNVGRWSVPAKPADVSGMTEAVVAAPTGRWTVALHMTCAIRFLALAADHISLSQLERIIDGHPSLCCHTLGEVLQQHLQNALIHLRL